MTSIRHLIKDETGATAIEYGLLAGLLAIIVIACFALIREPIGGLFTSVITEFDTVGEKL